jgi:hypothetical protein
MPSTPVVTDWSTAVMSSVAAALALLLSGIPKLIGFLIIVIIGWLIASAIARAVAAILRAVRFNDLAQRAGLTGFVRSMGLHTDAAGLLANVPKWFVRLIVLVTAFDALGLPAVSQVLQQLVLWLAAPKMTQAAEAAQQQAPASARPQLPARSNGAAPPVTQTVVRPNHS